MVRSRASKNACRLEVAGLLALVQLTTSGTLGTFEARPLECPQRVRDPVVFLHEPCEQTDAPGDDLNEVREIRLLVQKSHGAVALAT